MEYILEISKAALDAREHALTFPQIHNIIVQKAIEIQRMKTIDAGKAWRSYDKQAFSPTFMKVAATKTIRAMISWGLFEKEGKNTYVASEDLLEIGKSVLERREISYKRHIIQNMIRNDSELVFTPSRYLIPIRDFRLPARLLKGLEYFPSEEAFPRTSLDVKRILEVNMVDFDMMSTWGQFFNFTNEFNPKILDVEGAKQIFLACWIASVADLAHVYKMISRSGEVAESDSRGALTNKALEHSKTILEELGLIQAHEIQQIRARTEVKTSNRRTPTPRTLAEQLKETDGIIVSEDERARGIWIREDVNPAKVFVILPRKVSDQVFTVSIVKYYRHLKEGLGSPYVWVSQLRAMCCRELGIQDQVFDESLMHTYSKQPDKFEFSMIGGDASRGKIRPFGKPFRLYDQIFRMVRLEDHLVD
jgi:hypothetical protein